VLKALLALTALAAAAGCGGGASASSGGTAAPASHGCPPARAASWHQWAARVHVTVFCPAWLPVQLDGEIGGDTTTVASAGRHWQVQFVWRADDFSQLIHVVFEGFAPGTWPARCGGRPCYGGLTGATDLGGRRVTWYARNAGSSTGHVAAVFHDGGEVYAVSLHVIDPYTPSSARATLRRIVAGLVPVRAG
jgi:hypothetical protein